MPSFAEVAASGQQLVCAEGYAVEMSRRGYLTAGPFIPEAILENAWLVRQLHEEYNHAGSDVTVACLYHVNRAGLESVGKADLLEKMNREALRICVEVARATKTWAAGNLCKSTLFDGSSGEVAETVRRDFKEQILWAVEADVDFFVCESFRELGEAKLCLEAVKEFGGGRPALVSFAPYADKTADGVDFATALQDLYDNGAVFAGLNCARGPEQMVALAREIRKTYKGPLSLSPVPFRTTDEHPTWATLPDPKTGKLAYPDDMEVVSCSGAEIEAFGRACVELDAKYAGLCCGNSARLTRSLSKALGKTTAADKYEAHFVQAPQLKSKDCQY